VKNDFRRKEKFENFSQRTKQTSLLLISKKRH